MKRAMAAIAIGSVLIWNMSPVGSAFQGSPDCMVSPASIDFGRADAGSSVEATLTVTNVNPGAFTFTLNTIVSDNPVFSVVSTVPPLPATLLSGNSVTVTVRFTCPPGVTGRQTGRLTLITTPPKVGPPGVFVCGPVMVTGVCGSEPAQSGTIEPETGGTVTDPATGASIEIPRNTLRNRVRVSVLTLNSPLRISRINNNCGVPIQTDERFPDVRGFSRATDIVRFEVNPCGTIVFGPSARITMGLLRSLFPRGLPLGSSLRLFELARSEGQPIFLDTGIVARVTGPGRFPGLGDFVSVPDIPVFSTFAAFCSGDVCEAGAPLSLAVAQAGENNRLFFPNIVTNGRQTRISIANPDLSATLPVTFTAYNEIGAEVGHQSQTVPVNRQESFQVSTLFPDFTGGSIIAERQGGGLMAGFYEIADNFAAPTILSGSSGVQTPQPALIFPSIKSANGGITEIRVFNSNASEVTIKLAGFTSLGDRINPTNSAQQALSEIMLPGFGTLVLSSTGSSNPYDVQLNFAALDGGYVIVQTTDGRGVTGGEIFGEMIGGLLTLAALNGLSFPSGCLASSTDAGACHVDTSPESPVPSVLGQRTLYATDLESNPAETILSLVNVSDSPAGFALTAFDPVGRFLKTVPRMGFITIGPHQVFHASMLDLFGFNPSPGYVRVEDQSSSFVGPLISRRTISGSFTTTVPLIADDPQLAQTATNTFFSRVQLDPPSASPGQTTGMLVFNPNNNPLQFTITVVDDNGVRRQSVPQGLVARGIFTRVRFSLSTLFPNLAVSGGFARVQVTTPPGPGQGGRIIPVASYRVSSVVSAVPQQSAQPE